MSQPLCSPEKDTNEEEDIIPTGIPTNIEYTNYDVSSSTTPESRGGDGTILSLLSSPETELRDYDIICSNGITDHDQDNHRGNIQMKEIIKGFVRKWNITNPEQRNQTCEDNLLEEIKHKIEEQDGRPSFLIRNADDTQWGIASDQFIHDEILREWRHYKDTYQPVVNDQKTNDDNHHGQEEENNDRDIEEQAISSISPHAKDVSALYKYRIQFSHEPNTSGTTRQHDPAEETNLQPLGHLHNYDAPHRSTTQAYSEVGELPKATSGFPDSSVPDIAMWEQEKEGGKCCGCCCDYRRAVIILCIIRLIYEGGAGGAMFMTPFGLEVQLSVLIGIAGSIAALIGALKFIPRLVALKVVEILANAFFFVVNLAITWAKLELPPLGGSWIIIIAFVWLIFLGLTMYPYVCLIMELCSGIMSPETYPREEYCCCRTSCRKRQYRQDHSTIGRLDMTSSAH